jgi:hypothetical protein
MDLSESDELQARALATPCARLGVLLGTYLPMFGVGEPATTDGSGRAGRLLRRQPPPTSRHQPEGPPRRPRTWADSSPEPTLDA